MSSRLIFHRPARICATSNCVFSWLSITRRKSALKGPDPPRALAARGVRVMDSTPHAMARSYAPASTPWATKWTACCDEPHWRSTVVAGTCQGRPAATQALRATFVLCSPTWVTQPATTSSTNAGSTAARSSRACRTWPSRSAGCQPASAPLRLPIGVRTASTMTASRVCILPSGVVAGVVAGREPKLT